MIVQACSQTAALVFNLQLGFRQRFSLTVIAGLHQPQIGLFDRNHQVFATSREDCPGVALFQEVAQRLLQVKNAAGAYQRRLVLESSFEGASGIDPLHRDLVQNVFNTALTRRTLQMNAQAIGDADIIAIADRNACLVVDDEHYPAL
ncbi:hypothetical protein D3C85_962600 [compost metagenome]